MPTYYEGSVGSVKTQITREEFSQAWRLDQEKNGRLKNIGVKRAAAVAAFLLVLVWGIPVYSRYFDTIWAPLVLAAGCGFAIFYYGFLLPHWVSQQGEASFDSQKLLGEPCEIQLYRDSYRSGTVGKPFPAIGRITPPVWKRRSCSWSQGAGTGTC